MATHFFTPSSATRKGRRAGKQPKSKMPSDVLISTLLVKHFGQFDAADLNIAERQFPFRVRADLQRAIEKVFAEGDGLKILHFSGVRKEHAFDGIDFTGLLVQSQHQPCVAVPPQYEEIDIGEERPVRCLKVGLWLLERNKIRYAVLLSPALEHGRTIGIRFQIATFNDAAGDRLREQFFKLIEAAVTDCRSYRGKILSLELEHAYSGQSTGIKVHKLRSVERDQVILPEKTLNLLERNIVQFVQRRDKLSAFGQATKKGILFYGPPGTGKSHTIHYLAGALKGHTTLLITAEQIGLLGEYMALAKLLQPSIVVIEDVDLIARDRTHMHGPCEEALLNKLLNEMDGLKEVADILFILTTNRPEQLEVALASRPGRVDQAIEFPLPDDAGRRKLVQLYSGGVEMSDEVVKAVVDRTQKVSAAFIKELMRRSIQFHLERAMTRQIDLEDVENALDEMLFSGGMLNLKLLGGDTTAEAGVE
jgi:cell division protease FtsH